MGAINPWYTNIDFRTLNDFSFGERKLQFSIDISNFMNLLNPSWGVRKIASAAATSPLTLTGFNDAGEPILDFTGPTETFVDDRSLFSRWQVQVGLKLMF